MRDLGRKCTRPSVFLFCLSLGIPKIKAMERTGFLRYTSTSTNTTFKKALKLRRKN